jgi:putative tricarboxylic transport membrane protein
MSATSRDFTFGAVMLAVGFAYHWLTTQVPQSLLDDAVGPVGLPRLYAVILVALSVVTIVRAALAVVQRQPGQRDDTPHRSWRFAGMLLIGMLYVAIVPWLGYLPSIAVLIAGTAWYQGGVINRRVIIVSASGALLLWLLFVAFLRIPQPPGAWTSIF